MPDTHQLWVVLGQTQTSFCQELFDIGGLLVKAASSAPCHNPRRHQTRPSVNCTWRLPVCGVDPCSHPTLRPAPLGWQLASPACLLPDTWSQSGPGGPLPLGVEAGGCLSPHHPPGKPGLLWPHLSCGLGLVLGLGHSTQGVTLVPSCPGASPARGGGLAQLCKQARHSTTVGHRQQGPAPSAVTGSWVCDPILDTDVRGRPQKPELLTRFL